MAYADVAIKEQPLPAKRPNKLLQWWNRQWAAGLTVCVFRFIEVTTMLAIWLTAGYALFWLVYGESADPRRVRMEETVRLLGDNWHVSLLVLFVLVFGRAIRTFLERLKSAFGVEALAPADDSPEATANNPKLGKGDAL